MTETSTIVDGTTAAPDVQPRDGGITQVTATPAKVIDGKTNVTSGKEGPDPTGLRGTLVKNFAAAAERAAAQTNDAKPAPKPADAVSRETQGARGPDGKFLPKAAADTTAPVVEADEPPSSWRTETKALWKELEPKLGPEQAALLKADLRKRENDFKNGIMAKDAELRTAKPFYDEIQPQIAKHEYLWKDQGISNAQAVGHLLTLNANFRRDPAGTILGLAKSAGLDISKLAEGATQPGGNTADPQVSALYTHINGLTQKLHEIQSGISAQTTTAAASEIQSLIDEKDATGQPARPHFANDAVFEKIQLSIPALQKAHPEWSPRQVTQAAYDDAVWSVPETRQAMIDAQSGKAKADADAQARQRAAEAAAQSARGGSPNALNGKTDPKDLRGMLSARLSAHYNGGTRL